MIRDREIGDRLVVEVAPAQIVDIVSDGRKLEAEKPLAGSKIAQVQQKMQLGAGRAALLQGLTLRRRQREEQVPIALREPWEAPQQLVLFRGEDLQAIAALREAIIILKIVEREVGHDSAGSNGKTPSIPDRGGSPVPEETPKANLYH
jgi:hypothetical protein